MTFAPIRFLCAVLVGLTAGNPLAASAPRGPVASMFWTWQDPAIEDPAVLRAQFEDLAAAGFDRLYVMPRATRYEVFDPEMTAAVKAASALCRERGIEFIWGPDPRFGAHHVVTETGYGAEVLLTGREFRLRDTPAGDFPDDPDRTYLNESPVVDGRFSLHYAYPVRRDTHILTEVSLWFNPLKVEKVFAYQRSDDGVVAASVRDITEQSHFFINRATSYVEVFGTVDLGPGEWWVVAFPRFMTNMVAFDAPEHEAIMLDLLDRYAAEGIAFDGLWWDEPGYYFEYGHFAISERIYADFAAKYGYDLRARLHALLLATDDASHLRVRHDYFQLLMDYVFGGERRAWEHAESLWGPLRMGIHHTWHSAPDDMYHGSSDYWRGLEAVDGGYTDDGGFESYFSAGLGGRYEQVAWLVKGSSLAKFSRTGEAYYNRWGVNYTAEVPAYFNDLMPLFSNQWIQHSYGTTRAIGGGRDFGPGFPDHSTWSLLPQWIEKTREVYALTGCHLPVAEVAVVLPTTSLLVGKEPSNSARDGRVSRLIGAMPAAGVQVDVLSEAFFAEGALRGDGLFEVRGQRYRAIVLAEMETISDACAARIERLVAAGFPVHIVGDAPVRTLDGRPVNVSLPSRFAIGDGATLVGDIATLQLPSPVTALPGAYLTVQPGPDAESSFLLVMPIAPGATVGGEVRFRGQPVTIEPTDSLAIYEVSGTGAARRR